jgi:hypothetical protein
VVNGVDGVENDVEADNLECRHELRRRVLPAWGRRRRS